MGRDGHRAVITNRAAAAVSIIGPKSSLHCKGVAARASGFLWDLGLLCSIAVPCGTCRSPGGFEEEATSGSCERYFFLFSSTLRVYRCFFVRPLAYTRGNTPATQQGIRGEFPSDISLCNISALLQSHSIPCEHHGWFAPAQYQMTAVSSNRFSDTVADATPRVGRDKCGNLAGCERRDF